MPRCAAFLRGINVGGRTVASPQLCAPFEALGLEDVATVRASGNVVFTAPRGPSAALAKRIEQALQAALGYEVATFLRSAAQVRAICDHEPFAAHALAASTGKLQVVLLRSEPDAGQHERILSQSTPDDLLALQGRELYWLPRAGVARSALGMKGVGAIGLATVRTKATIELIGAKHFGWEPAAP